jgi:hypothetical protein
MAFPIVYDHADHTCRLTRLGPYIPCPTRHGNRVINAHHDEMRVGPDGLARAPPSGAAAVALPTDALPLQFSGDA